MLRTTVLLLVFVGTASSAVAQLVLPYTITGGNLTSGCVPPSPCFCPITLLGSVEGTFETVPIPGSLGPVFEYSVENVEWTVGPDPSGAVVEITGSGTYMIDVSSGDHAMGLDLIVNGIPQSYTSQGFVPGGSLVPSLLSIYLIRELGGCEFEAFSIEATSLPVFDAEFVRGDCNDDGAFDISDAVTLLEDLFVPGADPPTCLDPCDVNDSGGIDVADPIYVLANLFTLGPAPPPPYPSCGADPTDDALLFCDLFDGCP